MAGDQQAEKQAEQLKDLRVSSDELMEALDDMKRTEEEKRSHGVSTPEFHRLADIVDRKSDQVYRLAKGQEILGHEVDTTDETVEETPPEPSEERS